MLPAPKEIGSATVHFFTPIDERHRPTGNCQHTLIGGPQGPVVALAVCPEGAGQGFYLFGCDATLEVVTCTRHPTPEEAMRQAEFEYEGVSATWQRPE
jgi:hypothetical protein